MCCNSGMPHGRVQWALVIAAAVLNAVLLVWVLAFADDGNTTVRDLGSGATDPSDVTPSEPIPSDPTPSEPEPAPEHVPEDALQLGEAFVGEQADTTLLQTRNLRPPPDLDQSGEAWFGIRVQTCVHADAGRSGRVPPTSWVAKDAAGGRFAGIESPWDDFPPQQFSTDPISPGSCGVGWVLIPVPPGTPGRIETVAFKRSAVWAL